MVVLPACSDSDRDGIGSDRRAVGQESEVWGYGDMAIGKKLISDSVMVFCHRIVESEDGHVGEVGCLMRRET